MTQQYEYEAVYDAMLASARALYSAQLAYKTGRLSKAKYLAYRLAYTETSKTFEAACDIYNQNDMIQLA